MNQVSVSHQKLLDLLDQGPMRAIHYRMWLCSCGGTLLNGVSLLLLGVALPLLAANYHLSASMLGLIGAALVFGSVPGSLLGGRAADRFGRKPLLLLDMVIVIVGALLSARADSPAMLFVGQLLVGFGIGIDFPVSAAYIAETMPARNRPRLMVAAIAFQGLGMLMGAVLGMRLLLWLDAVSAWRFLMLALAILALLVLLARLILAESPRWLMLNGRNMEAARVIAAMQPAARFASLRSAAHAGNHPHIISRAPASHAMSLVSLFRPCYLRRTALVSVPWFLMDIATYGIALFTPLILGSFHLVGAGGGLVLRDVGEARGSALIDMGLLAGALLSLWLVPRFGAIRMQVNGFVGMAAGMALMLASFALPVTDSLRIVLIMLGFSLYNLSMNAGPNATTFTLAPAFFPTQLRASAGGFASGVAKLGASLGVLTLPLVKADWGLATVLLLMMGVSLAGALLTAWLGRGLTPASTLEAYHQAGAGL